MTAESTSPTSARPELPHVLVVTKHEGFATVAFKILSANKYAARILTPETVQGPNWAPAGKPEVALVDLLQDKGGELQLYERVRSTVPDCQIILICSLTETAAAARLTRIGDVCDYILTDAIRDEHRLPLLVELARARRNGNDANQDLPGSGTATPKQLRAKVLVVDDDATSCDLAKFILERHGYSVSLADSVEKARFGLNHNTPDLVLMDVHIGKMNGIEIVDAVRKGIVCDNPSIPIIMLTADRGRETLLSAAERNIQGYILKPYLPGVLVQKVESTLRAAAKRAVKVRA